MAKSEIEALKAAQQTELDAVLLYQELSKLMKSEEEKEIFIKMAADEGRHGAILRGITGAELKPKPMLAKAVCTMYKLLGRRVVFPLMSNFEINSFFSYQEFFTKYPEITKIAADEIRHGHMLASMM